MRIGTTRRLLPVLVPVITMWALSIVFIKLGCLEGTGCGNVTAWEPHYTPFQQFLNNWQVG